MAAHTSKAYGSAWLQVNEGLSDVPADVLDFSMKQELEQVVHLADCTALTLAQPPACVMHYYIETASRLLVWHSACIHALSYTNKQPLRPLEAQTALPVQQGVMQIHSL